jgi:hypothetical protein
MKVAKSVSSTQVLLKAGGLWPTQERMGHIPAGRGQAKYREYLARCIVEALGHLTMEELVAAMYTVGRLALKK